MMRKILTIFVCVFIIGMILSDTGEAAVEQSSPKIILYTFFWQIGEDDRLEIGSLDESGVTHTLSGYFSEMEWPNQVEEQLKYLAQTEKFNTAGTLDSNEIFAVKSLIYSVEKQAYDPVYTGILDGGTEESYAVRYSKEGEPEFILLGKSGEVFYENTDPNAQALYLRLRTLFPGVPNDAYDEPGMGPEGFKPIPLAEFTGLETSDLLNAEITAYLTDCEEGSIPLELTAEDKSALMDLIRNGTVKGKADCVSSTGGVTGYTFHEPDGSQLGTVEFEDGLLVTGSGRYYIE